MPTTIIGLLTLALIVALLSDAVAEGSAFIIAVAAATILLAILSIPQLPTGAAFATVQTVGDITTIPRSLPRLVLPDPSFIFPMLLPAFSVAIIGLIQGAGVSQGTPNPNGKFPNVSRDFFGQGAANLATSFVGGPPAGGSISGTALIMGAGASSRWTNILAGLFVALVVLLFAPLVELVPMPALAALLIVAGFQGLRIEQAVVAWNTGRITAVVMIITFVATLFVSLQFAVLLGVALSIVLHVVRASNKVKVTEWALQPNGFPIEQPPPKDAPSNQFTLLNIYGSLFFGAASSIEDMLPKVERSDRGGGGDHRARRARAGQHIYERHSPLCGGAASPERAVHARGGGPGGAGSAGQDGFAGRHGPREHLPRQTPDRRRRQRSRAGRRRLAERGAPAAARVGAGAGKRQGSFTMNHRERRIRMTLIAINILLDPDPATVGKAQTTNARLREDYPDGFALDANHAPHITLLQRFVRTADLDAIADAVAEVLRTGQPVNWESDAIGYYALIDKNLGLVGIVIRPTEDLRRLQQSIIDAVAPFAMEKGTGEAFAPRLDGGAIGQPTVDYVNNFVGPRTGVNYNPHLTVGIGTRDFVDALKAEPFEAFTVRAVSVSLYQLGDYGVAQRKLYDLHVC